MGALNISQLKNQFVKDIANQCDIVKPNGQLEGKELSIFRERTKHAITCNLLDEKDLTNDLMKQLDMDLDHNKAENAKRLGKTVYKMLDGYTKQSEYYFITQCIQNLNSHTKDFLRGYQTIKKQKAVDWSTWETIYENVEKALSICEKIAGEWFYSEKEDVIKTLCKKVLAEADLLGDSNSPEYKTLLDIVKNQDILKLAEDGTIDYCIALLVQTFTIDEDVDSLLDKIEKK